MGNGILKGHFSRPICGLALLLIAGQAFAQSADVGPGLLDERLVYANDVERSAAAANQATFDSLDTACNPNGQLDGIAAPTGFVRPDNCSELQFFVYLTTRELVHSANALLGEGPTIASLGVTQQGLGTALRWTAAEELAVQGSMATQFSNNQLANLASRLTALRSGARGFTVAGLNSTPESWGRGVLAGLGLNESPGQSDGNGYSRWGGFFNGTAGSGDREATGNENAFDFDNQEFTIGLDYRVRPDLVIGGMVGYSSQTVDFDPNASRVSVVSGNMESEGNSALLFALINGENLYVSASVGSQQIDYELQRDIRYPSFNAALPDSNSRATSTPEATTVTGTFDIGYAWTRGAVTVEPYLGIDYVDVTIDAFEEARSFSLLSGLIDNDGFNLVVAEQTFQSLDTTVGLRFQYTLTPTWGVVSPYVTFEYHRELQDAPRTIQARYAGAGNEAFAFSVATDPFDSDFYLWSVGVSSVIRGGRERRYDGPVSGGVSVYAQYQSVAQLEFFSEQTLSLGIRYEF
ncbi:MAG: autotransporter outer membrane beta-barrel domain-containing protein [Woeseiaceae bacterium]